MNRNHHSKTGGATVFHVVPLAALVAALEVSGLASPFNPPHGPSRAPFEPPAREEAAVCKQPSVAGAGQGEKERER